MLYGMMLFAYWHARIKVFATPYGMVFGINGWRIHDGEKKV